MPEKPDEYLDGDALAEEVLAFLCKLDRDDSVTVRSIAQKVGSPESTIRGFLEEMNQPPQRLVETEHGRWWATADARRIVAFRKNRIEVDLAKVADLTLSAEAQQLLVKLAQASRSTTNPIDPILDLALPELEDAGYVVWVDDTFIALTQSGLGRALKLIF